MELIPESHKYPFVETSNLINIYQKKITIDLDPGDILIFYSTMLHRGIFYNNISSDRKLIQVFDCYNSQEYFDKYNKLMMHVPGRKNIGNFLVNISKNKILSYPLNIYSFINAAMGYGICNFDNIKYISFEGNCDRLEIENDKWQDINKYILVEKNIITLVDKNSIDSINFTCYTKQYIYYTIILFVLFYIIYKIIKKNYKNIM
jgi:hypothetical protein